MYNLFNMYITISRVSLYNNISDIKVYKHTLFEISREGFFKSV